MKLFQTSAAGLAALLVSGCAILGPREPAPARAEIEFQAPHPRAVLVLVGGNSECRDDRGLIRYHGEIIQDLRSRLGLTSDQLSIAYYSWTGDPVSSRGCIPGRLPWFGDVPISRALEERGYLRPDVPLIIMGHSNGGATAYDLAARLCTRKSRPASLLVTFDPVSRIDPRARRIGADTWLHTYVPYHTPVIRVGGPWRSERAADLNLLVQTTHGGVPDMWAATRDSEPFRRWQARFSQGRALPSDVCRPLTRRD